LENGLQCLSLDNRKEVKLYLANGAYIKISLLGTKLFDMANGNLLIIGKVIDQVEIPLLECPLTETAQWKQSSI
jgi:hypothetical protein